MNFNDGFISANFTESTPNFSGTKMKAKRVKSLQTQRRERAAATILALAKEKGLSVDAMIAKIMQSNVPAIREYVIQHKEKPASDPNVLGVQAMLLRSQDAATIAKAIDTTDGDALQAVESAEQEATEMNSADASPLPSDVLGALAIMMQYMKGKHIDNGGTGSLVDITTDLTSKSTSNGFDMNTADLLDIPAHDPIGSKSPGGSRLGNVSKPDNAAGPVYNVPGVTSPATTTSSSSDGGDGSVWGSIFGIIDGVVGAVTKVSSSLQAAKDSANNVIDKLKGAASDVGSDSISKSLKANLPMIIGIIAAVILVIFLVIYATRRK